MFSLRGRSSEADIIGPGDLTLVRRTHETLTKTSAPRRRAGDNKLTLNQRGAFIINKFLKTFISMGEAITHADLFFFFP